MATKTPADYKAQHAAGYTCQKLGFDNRRPFNMGLRSQQTAESPFKAKFEPHMMYKDGEEVMAKTYEKHLELKEKGYSHEKPKSPAKLFKKRKARRALREEKYGTKSRSKARKITGKSKKSQKFQETLDKGKKRDGESVNMSNRDYAKKHLGYEASPAKQKVDEATRKKNLAAQIKKRKEEAGEGFMTAPYRDPKSKGPRANRKDLSYHGYTNFKSNVTGKKVHKDGVKEKYGNPAKSDAQKKVEQKRKEFNSMTPAQKKVLQDKANAKRKAFENSPEYKKRKEKQMSKN
tara:strand:+ start:1061 stop:1930 length:870 start_codon:yes stop_codon:yes gene_type:complete